MKKKIYFYAPKNKGGTYYYYEGISSYFHMHCGSEFEVFFITGYIEYLKIHFIKADVIFSIVPLFFKPLRAKKYIFNLHGNYLKEGNIFTVLKTLRLYQLNLWFSDRIMLVSNYLADEIGFFETYKHKIKIIGNYVSKPTISTQIQSVNKGFKFLTITSSSFWEKSRGIIDIIKVLELLSEEYPEKNIYITIIGIKDIFVKNKIIGLLGNIPPNILIDWKPWLNKKQLEEEYLKHNYFLYWSYLDNFPGVILEALSYGLVTYVSNYKSYPYFLDSQFIAKDRFDMCRKIISTEPQNRGFVSKYYIDNIAKEIKLLIYENTL